MAGTQIQSGISVSKLGIVKTFKGTTPPDLKKGELATDGESLFMRLGNGNIAKFSNAEKLMELAVGLFQEHIDNYHQE